MNKNVKNIFQNVFKNDLFLYFFIVLFLLFAWSCSTIEKDDDFIIDQIILSIDYSEQQIVYDETYFYVTFESTTEQFIITLQTKDHVLFHNEINLIINNQEIDLDFHLFETTKIVYTINIEDVINLDSYINVKTSFDLNGGFWRFEMFDYLEPYDQIQITSLNDLSGLAVTLFDQTMLQMRWYYKLFLAYDPLFDAYRVIYFDHATASVENLNIDNYDIGIAVHDRSTNQIALSTIKTLIEDLAEQKVFIVFDQEIDNLTSVDLVATIYDETSLSSNHTIKMFERADLPIPVRPEFTFLGWFDGNILRFEYEPHTLLDGVTAIHYEAVWEGVSLEMLVQKLNSIIPSKLNQHLILINSYSQYTIDWFSSDEEILTSEGLFKRPYQPKQVTLTALISSIDEQLTLTFDLDASSYKPLNTGIASSYIYRNYILVDDLFFETLDIINCAFITANDTGDLIGTNFLYNVERFIMPKAKLYGNWVVLSIAPESSYSKIAADPTLINYFADQIVDIINLYGFDGVDIDWETPTSQEKYRFTNLMQVVYQKVKANNINHLVTTAITGGMWQPPRYDLLNSFQYLDYINLMTYGMASSSGYYQNPLYPSSQYHHQSFLAGRSLLSASISESIHIFENDFLVSRNKIIVGVAFYGIMQQRTFNNSTNKWSNWSNQGSVHFPTILNNLMPNPLYTYYFDDIAKVPYLIKNDGTTFISFDDETSILEKSKYILDQQIGGIMFWEYGTDSTNTLLLALKKGMKK